jgi:hypothetical protein
MTAPTAQEMRAAYERRCKAGDELYTARSKCPSAPLSPRAGEKARATRAKKQDRLNAAQKESDDAREAWFALSAQLAEAWLYPVFAPMIAQAKAVLDAVKPPAHLSLKTKFDAAGMPVSIAATVQDHPECRDVNLWTVEGGGKNPEGVQRSWGTSVRLLDGRVLAANPALSAFIDECSRFGFDLTRDLAAVGLPSEAALAEAVIELAELMAGKIRAHQCRALDALEAAYPDAKQARAQAVQSLAASQEESRP